MPAALNRATITKTARDWLETKRASLITSFSLECCDLSQLFEVECSVHQKRRQGAALQRVAFSLDQSFLFWFFLLSRRFITLLLGNLNFCAVTKREVSFDDYSFAALQSRSDLHLVGGANSNSYLFLPGHGIRINHHYRAFVRNGGSQGHRRSRNHDRVALCLCRNSHLGGSVGPQPAGTVSERHPNLNGTVRGIGRPADKRNLTGHLIARLIGRQNRRRIANVQLRSHCIGKRSLNDYLADVGDGDQLASSRRELAFILKLIGYHTSNRRANSSVA